MTDDALSAALAQRQLDAYNAHDLEAFLACYAEDCEAAFLASGERRFKGMAEMRSVYGTLFATNPALRCELRSRSTMGRFCFDEESLSGYDDGRTARATAIYETRNGLIARVWFVAP